MEDTPEYIDIFDDYGGKWRVTPDDGLLWPIVLSEHQLGIEPIVVPARVLREKRGWGWWTVAERQLTWLAELGIPMIDDPNLLVPQEASGLAEALQRYGGYASYLSAMIGRLEGLTKALEDSYDVAVGIAATKLEGATRLTEKSKEAQVLAMNETLRETKRREIETAALLATAKGLKAGYERAWDTVSRLITLYSSETGLATGRSN